MADNKRTYVKYVTPVGTARFPKLHKKDVYKGKETKYVLDIVFDDATLKQVKKAVKEAQAKIFGKRTPDGGPFRTDKKDGTEYLHVTSGKLVPLFGRGGDQKLPEGSILGGGSQIKARISFTEANDYLVAWLDSVQVGKLVQGGEGGGFDEWEEDADDSSDEGDDSDDGDLDI